MDNRPPSKKLSLEDRVFTVTVKHADGHETVYDATAGLFSQALEGNMSLKGSDGSQLKIAWEHPQVDTDAHHVKLSKPFSERNARNDIRGIDPYIVDDI